MLRRYLVKRLFVAIPSLLIASLIVFTLPRLIPGDVVQLMLEEKAYAKDLEELREKLGLSRPLYIQYFEWAGRALRGDLGESLWTKRPVIEEIGRRLPITLELAFMAIVIALAHRHSRRRHLGDPAGHPARLRGAQRGHPRPVRARLLAGHPIIVLPAIWWGWRPLTGFTEFSKDPWGHFTQLLLPAIILGVAAAAALMRLTRGMLLEVLRQDYVRTAWAKGLAESVIVAKHSLRNAIIPVVTLLGTQLPQVIGGTVIIETIFGLPGMSRFLFDAINQRDYPVIQGVNLVVVVRRHPREPHRRRPLCRPRPANPLLGSAGRSGPRRTCRRSRRREPALDGRGPARRRPPRADRGGLGGRCASRGESRWAPSAASSSWPCWSWPSSPSGSRPTATTRRSAAPA